MTIVKRQPIRQVTRTWVAPREGYYRNVPSKYHKGRPPRRY